MEKKKIRFGIFGLSRGNNLIGSIQNSGAEVAALCDYRPAAVAACKKEWFKDRDIPTFSDFEEFIKADFDVVLLANYFCEHAKYAIKSMRAGKHVLSETLPNITMAEGVALCRVKEETGMVYSLLENYPYFKSNLERKKLFEEGVLGNLIYAEGEYPHPMSKNEMNNLAPGERHWRNWTPRTYYSTHALAPLIYMTGAMPTKVSAMASYQPEIAEGTALRTGDAAAVIMCQTDTNAIFRVIGWACYACHGSRYRLCGTRGCAETNPTTHELRIQYNPWTRPEGVEKNVVEYKAEWPDNELGKLADNSGHDGGDFWAIYFFVKAMEAGEEPFFNVYRATTIASVAILAWRSILNDNKCYDVPDFRKEEDRKKYENDNISPYPDENYCVNIPCSSQPYAPSEEDIENARRFWQNADYLHE